MFGRVALLRMSSTNLNSGRARGAFSFLRLDRCARGAWAAAWLALSAAPGALGEVPELRLPRPGSVVVGQVIGDVAVKAGNETKPAKPDERIRVGVTIVTGPKSLVVLELSNGSVLRMGSESELELEEFGQQPFSSSVKPKEEKEEPSLSRTRLNLLRGDLAGDVKRLKVQRGSSFLVSSLPGTLRVTEGSFHLRLRMTEIGLGVCTLDFPAGVAEFEPVGGSFARVPVGRRLGFALEVDKPSGTVRLSELPKASEPPPLDMSSLPVTRPAAVTPPTKAKK